MNVSKTISYEAWVVIKYLVLSLWLCSTLSLSLAALAALWTTYSSNAFYVKFYYYSMAAMSISILMVWPLLFLLCYYQYKHTHLHA